MESLKWCIVAVLLWGPACEAYKILAIFPMPGISHGILGDGFVKHLLNAGHEVYYVTPFVKNNTHPNLHQVDVSANKKLFNENSLNVKAILDKQIDFSDMDFVNEFMVAISISTLENENLLSLLKDPKQRFDVVIAEWMFTELYSVLRNTEQIEDLAGFEYTSKKPLACEFEFCWEQQFGVVVSYCIPAALQCPLIWFSTLEPHWQILSLIDETLHPAYNSDYGHSFQPPFTFSQRVYVLYKQLEGYYLKNFKYNYKEEAAYLKHVVPILKQKGLPVPTYEELEYNASLVLGNSHVSLGVPTRLPQNYINIAGYHIEEPVKPLSKDLKTVMDNAKNGVIYFSLGSNLKSKDLPEATKKGLVDVFRGLKQTVIWKFEEVMSDIPKNVHVVQWAPQPSILAHPNCVLFITHGGLLSLTEAVHYAVPVIAIPVFADQFINADRVAHKGFGVKLDLSYTLHETIGNAIKEVLGNPKYTDKVKELSFIYHDRLTSPGAEIVHWVQHVIRTRGAPHLQSLALNVPLYQKLYLDLIALVIIALYILKTIILRMLCIITIRKLDSKKLN